MFCLPWEKNQLFMGYNFFKVAAVYSSIALSEPNRSLNFKKERQCSLTSQHGSVWLE